MNTFIQNRPYQKFQFEYRGRKYSGFYRLTTKDFLRPFAIFDDSTPANVFEPSDAKFKELAKSSGYLQDFQISLSMLKAQVNSLGLATEANQYANQSGQGAVWTATVPYIPGTPQAPNFTPPAPLATQKREPIATMALGGFDPKRVISSAPALPDFDKAQALKYPIDAYNQPQFSQDHMIIEMFSYSPPQENMFGSATGRGSNVSSGFLINGLRRNNNISEFRGLVKLPIPNQLAFTNGVNWGADSANAFTAAAFNTATNAAQPLLQGNFFGATKELANDLLSGAASILGTTGTTGGTGTLLTALAAKYGLGKIGINVDPNQFIARASGNAINPNLELLFNGPKLRDFEFNFEFAPNGEAEATEVRRIMRFFRRGMMPRRGENNDLIFLGSPDVFRIRYRTGNERIRGLNIFKICALTECTVNFAPQGEYQSYKDSKAGSQPVLSSMTLNFTELTPIFAQDYDADDGKDPSLQDMFQDFGSPVKGIEPLNSEDIGF